MDRNLLNIALTGTRCSGKDVVAKLFRQIGVPVFDADAIIKYILNYRKSISKSVLDHFGKEYLFDNYINPYKFDDDEKIERLISLIEFELFESYEKFRSENINKQYTVFHSSIIHEKNWSKKFDFIVCVFAPKEERIARYHKNTSESLQKIHLLFSKEISDIVKNDSSDFIIHNYIEAPSLLEQVENIDDKIIDYFLSLNKNTDDFSDNYYKNIITF